MFICINHFGKWFSLAFKRPEQNNKLLCIEKYDWVRARNMNVSVPIPLQGVLKSYFPYFKIKGRPVSPSCLPAASNF